MRNTNAPSTSTWHVVTPENSYSDPASLVSVQAESAAAALAQVCGYYSPATDSLETAAETQDEAGAGYPQAMFWDGYVVFPGHLLLQAQQLLATSTQDWE